MVRCPWSLECFIIENYIGKRKAKTSTVLVRSCLQQHLSSLASPTMEQCLQGAASFAKTAHLLSNNRPAVLSRPSAVFYSTLDSLVPFMLFGALSLEWPQETQTLKMYDTYCRQTFVFWLVSSFDIMALISFLNLLLEKGRICE